MNANQKPAEAVWVRTLYLKSANAIVIVLIDQYGLIVDSIAVPISMAHSLRGEVEKAVAEMDGDK